MAHGSKTNTTPEQRARDIIEQCTGDADTAQSLSAGEVVELANMIAAVDHAFALAVTSGNPRALLDKVAAELRPYTVRR
jgi:hypothetical protein